MSKASTNPLSFNLDGERNRLFTDWGRDPKLGARVFARSGTRVITRVCNLGAMRRYAKANGAAGAWKADDSFLLMYRDTDGKVRQKTWTHARPVQLDAAA